MFSCLRSSSPGIPLKVRSTTNPWGPAHNEIKERFRIAERMNGEILGPLVEDDVNERDEKLPPRRAIFGHINENKLLAKSAAKLHDYDDPGRRKRRFGSRMARRRLEQSLRAA